MTTMRRVTALFNVDDYIVDLLQRQGMITDEQISLVRNDFLVRTELSWKDYMP